MSRGRDPAMDQAHALRGMIKLATVKSTDDSGETQTASVELDKHVERSDVEIMQAAGMGSRPKPGSAMLVFAVGGDSGHLVGLPVSAPGNRMGDLGEGEGVLYSAGGDKVYVKDGAIVIETSGTLTIKAANIVIDGNVAITGSVLTHNGKNVGDTHKHTGVTPGAAQTGAPA